MPWEYFADQWKMHATHFKAAAASFLLACASFSRMEYASTDSLISAFKARAASLSAASCSL